MLAYLKRIKVYPLFFQLLTLTCFGWLLYALGDSSSFSSINWGMIVFWHIWWPFVPLLILLFGSFWCSICPLSAIAVAINRILPCRFFPANWINRNGLTIALVLYLVIVGLDAIFVLEYNAGYTRIFISGLFGLMLLLVLLFGYKAFCLAACPVGLFTRVYHRFSLAGLESNEHLCGKCKRQTWDRAKPLFGKKSGEVIPEPRDWRYRVECLKRCPSHATRMVFHLPPKENGVEDCNSIVDAFAPSFLLTTLGVSILIKSNYATGLYRRLLPVIELSYPIFIALLILALIIFFAMINGGLFFMFRKTIRKNPGLFLFKMRSLVPLLILFHIALVLDEFRGLIPVGYEFPALSFLQTAMPESNVVLISAYLLTGLGIVLALIYSFFGMKTKKSPESAVDFNLSLTIVFLIVLGGYAIFSLKLLQIMQTSAC